MRGVVARGFPRELPSPVGEHPFDARLTTARTTRLRQVLARRTRRLAVVVEDCYDPQNATAVVRTCDALGIMRVHVVTGRNRFQVNRRVSQGSHLYLDLRCHAAIDTAYAGLRADGYRILATDLGADAVVGAGDLRQQLEHGPLALVFGNEGHGLSPAARAGADGRFLLPMVGCAQSLNLSATAAITLYRLREPELVADEAGDLSAAEQTQWYDRWVRRGRGEAHPEAADDVDRRGQAVDVFAAED